MDVSRLKCDMRQYLCKLVSVLLLLVACRAHAFYPEHVWAIGCSGNSYGMAQWDDFDVPGGVAGHKRTVIYFGTHQWVVHQSSASILGTGLLGGSALIFCSVLAGSPIRRKCRHESYIS